MEKQSELPKPNKFYQYMTIDELNNLSQDHQRALALKATLNTAENVKRIKNNVVFFFWLTIISGVIVFISVMEQM